MGRNLFIDAEWFLDQRIYLIGYAYNLSACYQLHDMTMNRYSFATILRDVDAIYCYGPDIGIERSTMEYKTNIFQLHKDWKNPLKKHYAMKYNREDVHNMIRVKNYFFQLHNITRKDIEKYRL